MAATPEDVRRDGDFPIIVSNPQDKSDARGTDATEPHPGPSPGLPPHTSDVSDSPIPGDNLAPSPTRLPGDPAPLDDRPLHNEDMPRQVP